MGRHRDFDAEAKLLMAMDVFWKHGYTATGMTDLCRSMELNPGSVYAAFGNKDQLFLSAVRAYLQKVTAEGINKVNASENGIEGIRQYFEYVAEGILTGRRRFGCFGTNSLMEMGERDAEVRAIMLEHFALLEETFCTALRRAGVRQPSEQAAYLMCVAQGLNVLARTQPDRETLRAIIQNTFNALSASVENQKVAAFIENQGEKDDS